MANAERQSVHDRSCDLCGLPGHHPYAQRIHEQERFFCCLGCMNVYLILSESVPAGQTSATPNFSAAASNWV
jgi:hypothetical protein